MLDCPHGNRNYCKICDGGPMNTLYDVLKCEVEEIDHIIIRNDDNGYSQDYANARTQLLIAKALVDIAESLDAIRKSVAASVPDQLQ
jgi:hypothetical protein